MLSRVAESIYWMSRYVERAENVARFVDVNLNLMLDAPSGADQQWWPLVNTTGDHDDFEKRHGKATQQNVIHFLTFDRDNPNSVVSCLRASRENARSVREIISSEMWLQLNKFYLMVNHAEATGKGMESPAEFFDEVKNACHLFNGVTAATMTHGEAWHFGPMLGRMLERADKTSRILDLRYKALPEKGVPKTVNQTDVLEWSAILRSCSAWDAYKSIHGAEVSPRLVAEFLLLNEDFPRSARFCIGKLNVALRRISGVAEDRFCNDAEKLAGRLVAELQFSTIDEIFEAGLHDYLDLLQMKLNNIGAAMFNTYIFQPFSTLEEEIMVQQEEQQQQERRPPARRVPVGVQASACSPDTRELQRAVPEAGAPKCGAIVNRKS